MPASNAGALQTFLVAATMRFFNIITDRFDLTAFLFDTRDGFQYTASQ
jgi:hypothetical protein